MNETLLILSFAHFKRTAKHLGTKLRETGKNGRKLIVMEELKPVSHLINILLQKVNKIFDGIKVSGNLVSGFTGINFELSGEKLQTGQYSYRVVVSYRGQIVKQRQALTDEPAEIDKDQFSKVFLATSPQEKAEIKFIQNQALADKWYPFKLTAVDNLVEFEDPKGRGFTTGYNNRAESPDLIVANEVLRVLSSRMLTDRNASQPQSMPYLLFSFVYNITSKVHTISSNLPGINSTFEKFKEDHRLTQPRQLYKLEIELRTAIMLWEIFCDTFSDRLALVLARFKRSKRKSCERRLENVQKLTDLVQAYKRILDLLSENLAEAISLMQQICKTKFEYIETDGIYTFLEQVVKPCRTGSLQLLYNHLHKNGQAHLPFLIQSAVSDATDLKTCFWRGPNNPSYLLLNLNSRILFENYSDVFLVDSSNRITKHKIDSLNFIAYNGYLLKVFPSEIVNVLRIADGASKDVSVGSQHIKLTTNILHIDRKWNMVYMAAEKKKAPHEAPNPQTGFRLIRFKIDETLLKADKLVIEDLCEFEMVPSHRLDIHENSMIIFRKVAGPGKPAITHYRLFPDNRPIALLDQGPLEQFAIIPDDQNYKQFMGAYSSSYNVEKSIACNRHSFLVLFQSRTSQGWKKLDNLIYINLHKKLPLQMLEMPQHPHNVQHYHMMNIKNHLFCVSSSLLQNSFNYAIWTVHSDKITLCVDWLQSKPLCFKLNKTLFGKCTRMPSVVTDAIINTISLWTLETDIASGEVYLQKKTLRIKL